jgi:diaminobutyrate-2-oxoglutarate transaminase
MGERLLNLLCPLVTEARTAGDVRGRGLMVGVEIIDRDHALANASHPPCWPEMAQRIQQEALKRGLIVELGGRFSSVVRFLPPLIVTQEQIDRIAAIFTDSILAAEAGLETPSA